MSTWKIIKLSWVNLPLLVASGFLLVVAWFVPSHRDPDGHGDIMLSSLLSARALCMPPSKWVTLLGCSVAAMSLAGNGDLLPVRSSRIPIVVVLMLLLVAIFFWKRLISRRSCAALADPKDTNVSGWIGLSRAQNCLFGVHTLLPPDEHRPRHNKLETLRRALRFIFKRVE